MSTSDPMVDKPPGLRERKKLERRNEIEATALELFETGGFDHTTIEAIATAVGISPRTFFYYFATKEDVVLADYERRLERMVEELAQQPEGQLPWASLRASFVVVAADYETEQRQLVRRFAIIADNPAVYARSLQLQAGWEDTLAGALAQRMGVSARHAIWPRLLSASALALMRSSIRHWFETGCEAPLPPLVDRCFDQLSAGLADVDGQSRPLG